MVQRLKILFSSTCLVILLTAGNTRAQNNDTLDDLSVEMFDDQFDSGSDARSIYADIPQFGGPTSVGGQIAEDAVVVPQWRLQGLQDHFEPWYRFKERLNQCHGLQFNVDESMLTGEPTPKPKQAGDEVVAGTINKSGTFLYAG